MLFGTSLYALYRNQSFFSSLQPQNHITSRPVIKLLKEELIFFRPSTIGIKPNVHRGIKAAATLFLVAKLQINAAGAGKEHFECAKILRRTLHRAKPPSSVEMDKFVVRIADILSFFSSTNFSLRPVQNVRDTPNDTQYYNCRALRVG